VEGSVRLTINGSQVDEQDNPYLDCRDGVMVLHCRMCVEITT